MTWAHPEPDELERLGSFLIEMRLPPREGITPPAKREQLMSWVNIGRVEHALGLGTREPRRHVNILRSYQAERFRYSAFQLDRAMAPLVEALRQGGLADATTTFSLDQVKQTDGADWVEVEVFRYKEPDDVGPRAA